MAGMRHLNLSSVLSRWLAFSLLLLGSHADINTRFRVENGEGPITRSGAGGWGGSCNGIDADLVAIYDEAIDMAREAVTAMDNYENDATIRATVQTFFGIRPDGTAVSAADQAYFAYARGLSNRSCLFTIKSLSRSDPYI